MNPISRVLSLCMQLAIITFPQPHESNQSCPVLMNAISNYNLSSATWIQSVVSCPEPYKCNQQLYSVLSQINPISHVLACPYECNQQLYSVLSQINPISHVLSCPYECNQRLHIVLSHINPISQYTVPIHINMNSHCVMSCSTLIQSAILNVLSLVIHSVIIHCPKPSEFSTFRRISASQNFPR
jgi:hypothetical protein